MLVYGAGADPIWSEPESAPGPQNSGAGAAQKSGGNTFTNFLWLWSLEEMFYKKNEQQVLWLPSQNESISLVKSMDCMPGCWDRLDWGFTAAIFSEMVTPK